MKQILTKNPMFYVALAAFVAVSILFLTDKRNVLLENTKDYYDYVFENEKLNSPAMLE